MAIYSYKAKSVSGEVITGKFDALDKNMVVTLLRSKGLYPISISETKGEIGKGTELKIFQPKITLKDLAIFCRQFYTMLNAGVTVINSLDLLRKQTENKKLTAVISKIYEVVQRGTSLSDAMKMQEEVFPPILISMVEIGEVSGTLDIVLNRLSMHFEKENRILQKVKSATTYPTIIGCLALVMVFVLVTFIAPKFISMLTGVGGELPTATKMLMKFSGLLSNIWFLLVAFIVITGIVVGFKKLKKTERGKLILNTLSLRLPVIGSNTRKMLASRFTRSLALLLKTGVPLIQSLDVIGTLVNNQIVLKGMTRVKEEIRRGSNLAGPLDGINIFPPMVIHMINIGEESGTLDTTIEKVADFYDDELDASISKLISMIEPLLMIIMAVVVGSIVIAMILPIFEMQKNLGSM